MTRWFTLQEFRQICFELAASRPWVQFEPIPAFDTRFPGKPESCLAVPQQTFDGKPLYPTLLDQAAILFYLLIKNHPFANGNKRIALVALVVVLLINDRWLESTDDELYNLTIQVASSLRTQKSEIVEQITSFLETHITDIPEDFLETLRQNAEGLIGSENEGEPNR